MSKPVIRMIMSTELSCFSPTGTSNDSAEHNTPKFPLQGPANISAAIQAICLPQLRICGTLLGTPWLTGDKETLENVQEKAVKMVAGLRDKDYKER
jgi:hypothetical protein